MLQCNFFTVCQSPELDHHVFVIVKIQTFISPKWLNVPCFNPKGHIYKIYSFDPLSVLMI